MRLFRASPAWLACLTLAVGNVSSRADNRPDPLQLIPAQADFIFKVEQPKKLLEVFQNIAVLKEFGQLDGVREAYDSTNARRFFQLVAYFEKELGGTWPELVERLAGQGIAAGVHFGKQAPVVLVVQGKDEALLRKFFQLGLKVIEQELARQESQERPRKDVYRNIEVVHVGKQFFAAVAGPNLVLSNNHQAMKAVLDLHLGGGKKSIAQNPRLAEARKVLPAGPLAWVWLNMDPVRKLPQLAPLFQTKQNDAFITVSGGPFFDVARRAPFLCAGLYGQKKSLRLSLRFPGGLKGMPPGLAAIVSAGTQTSVLPLLEPRNVLYSASNYHDIAIYWEKRAQLFNKQQVATFERTDKQSGPFLAGTRLSQLLTSAGPHPRFVVVQQTNPGYKTQPVQIFPAGAFIIDMRDPEKFSKGMDSVLRAGALYARAGPFQFNLVEEKHGKWTIVGYRFPEADGKEVGPLRNDVNNIRFNFSPCFVRVGNQFVLSSTIELARELADLLEREAAQAGTQGRKWTSRARVYGSGGAAVMRIFKDQLLTLTILDRALPPKEAQKEVEILINLVSRLGTVQLTEQYKKNTFRYDVQWKWGG